MFCPKCGAAEQSVNSYCRKCGTFLPDFDAIAKKEIPIEEHLKINSFFSLASAIVGITLAITLYATLIGPHNAPIVVYITFGFLMAMSAWQIQTFIRTRMVKKQVAKLKPTRETAELVMPAADPASPKSLNEPDLENYMPASVTERTTRNLIK